MKLSCRALLSIAPVGVGILLASWLGAAAAQAPASGEAVARLGAVVIAKEEVERLLQGMPESERATVKDNRTGVENWLRQRLVGEAVLREARTKGWADRPEVRSRIEAAISEITARIVTTSYLESVAQLPADYPSEADVKAAYEQGKASFNLPPSYRVAQIFLATSSSDATAVAKVRDQAKALANQARSGDFASLARSRSDDKRSAEQGGEVGTLPLQQLLPEVRDVVAKLKVGQVSDPVQSPAGFHIMKLLDTQAARLATLDEMKPQLQTALRQQRQQQLVQTYLAGLATAGSLTIDSAALDAVLKKVN